MSKFDVAGDLIIDTINGIHRALGIADIEPKKSNTNGGEYTGPCARCKLLKGYGGEDRLQVWPSRPIESPGFRQDPVFYCRRCFRDDRPDKNWTGDLPEYISKTTGVSWWNARKALNLGARNVVDLIRTVPMASMSQAPNQTWQARAEAFVEECMERLWSETGLPALKYLMQERKLNEDVIRTARLGYQDGKERYESAESWGLDGANLRLHRGIVIPEIHYAPMGRGVEYWAIAIRRSPMDCANEALDRDIPLAKVPRYPAVRGSEKALLYGESITSKTYGVLVEGPLCGLTVIQEGRGEFGAGATQGNLGGRGNSLALRLLSRAQGHLVCFDPDEAGEVGRKYWLDLLDTSFEHSPVGGDINAMLMRGESVYDFLARGRDFLERATKIQVELTPSIKLLEGAVMPSLAQVRQSIIDMFAIPPSLISAPIVESTAEVTKICGWINEETGEVCTILENVDHIHEIGVECSKCSAEVERFNEDGTPYCATHYMSAAQAFAETLQTSLPWLRSIEVVSGLAPRHAKPIDVFEMAIEPVAVLVSKGCHHIRLDFETDGNARKFKCSVQCHAKTVDGLFCEEHRLNGVFMALGAELGYPLLALNQYNTIARGYAAWFEFTRRRTNDQLSGLSEINPDIMRDIPKLKSLVMRKKVRESA
jgi:hypothetical protein